MDTPQLTYSLSFRHSHGRNPPELIITLKDDVLAHVDHLLRTSRILEVSGLQEYLREEYANPWHEPELALKTTAFGIRQCGYVTSADGVSEIHFPYTEATLYRITMTVHVLLIALNWSTEVQAPVSNYPQLYAVSTRCEHVSEGWGHMVSADINPVFRRWLAGLAEDQRERIEEKIRESVFEAHVAFKKSGERRKHRKYFGHDCRSSISPEGRFYISCPGDACDIAIYPDSDSINDDYEYCTLSCHNLDTPIQQLSLLAGFATLCEFARIELEKG